jgi:hypothetical protein
VATGEKTLVSGFRKFRKLALRIAVPDPSLYRSSPPTAAPSPFAFYLCFDRCLLALYAISKKFQQLLDHSGSCGDNHCTPRTRFEVFGFILDDGFYLLRLDPPLAKSIFIRFLPAVNHPNG